MLAHTIEGLRARDYLGGKIKIGATITVTDAYTRVLITYPSDNLTISGMMQIPFGDGPFPVVILNHGYIAAAQYWSGADTWRAADYLSRHGYLTISPDFRGLARSDPGLNLFRAGYMIDALNAAASVKSLPYANAKRIGMWGHSMGGGVTTRAIVVSDLIKAAVLYAPVSADDSERRFSYYGGFGGSSALVPPDLADSIFYWVNASDFIDRVSPINYFRYVTAPVSIHQGDADTTVPPRWSQAIRDALIAQGKTVEYFEYPRQGHGFVGTGWDLFNQRVVRFFDKYLK
jgi:dipeptidyl aminopeptidase/acylaminoacyl peptidase